MAVYTLNEIKTFLADNVSEAIQPIHIRHILESFLLVYQEIGLVDNTTPLALDGTWQSMGLTSQGSGRNVVVTGEKMTVPVDGTYQISYRINFGAPLPAGTYEIAVFKDPDGSPARIDRFDSRFTEATEIVVCPPVNISLAANDEIALAIQGPNGESITVRDAGLSINRKE
jgi:hypothetical protein